MILFFTTLHKENEIKSFSFRPDKLEVGLDFLNFVSARGHVLLNAHIVDELGAVELPLTAFDGHPFAEPMVQLEKEWQKILKKPRKVSVSRHTKEMIALIRKRIQTYEARSNQLDLMISRLQGLRSRAKLLTQVDSGRRNLVDHYASLILNYQQSLERVCKDKNVALAKLQELQHS